MTFLRISNEYLHFLETKFIIVIFVKELYLFLILVSANEMFVILEKWK